MAVLKMIAMKASSPGGWVLALLTLCLYLAIVATFGRVIPAAHAGAPPTKVIIFKPIIPTISRTGECWTESIADDRSGCWRCMVGDAIFDPCFLVNQTMVCGANPRGATGFVLNLDKPLPMASQDTPSDVQGQPWLMELADGSWCGRLTGTMMIAEGEPVPYECSPPPSCVPGQCNDMYGVQDVDQTNKAWIAKKVIMGRATLPGGQLSAIKRESVPITTAWR